MKAGSKVRWSSPEKGTEGTLTSTSDKFAMDGLSCMSFTETVSIAGEDTEVDEVRCLEKGQWLAKNQRKTQMVRTLSFALLIGLISVPFDGFAQALGFSDCDLTDDGRYVCIADSTGRYTFVTKEIYNLVNVASGTASEVQEDSATHPDLDKVKAEMEQIKKERLEAEAQRKKELREAKALSIKLEKEMTAMKEEQEER